MLDRSIGARPGKTACIWGHMPPENALLSTVESTTGTSKTRAALPRIRLLLITVWRSKLATPNNICGGRSMNATAQLSGVSRPFSLLGERLNVMAATSLNSEVHHGLGA